MKNSSLSTVEKPPESSHLAARVLYNLGIAGTLAAIFVMDLIAPMGVEGGIPYAAVVLFTYWIKNDVAGHVVLGASTVLLFAPLGGGGFPSIHIADVEPRAYSAVGLWLIAIGFFLLKRSYDRRLAGFLTDFKQDRARVETKLLASEKRYRDFAEANLDGLWEVDENLAFKFLSDNFFSNTGFARELILGTPREDLISQQIEEGELARHMADLRARRPFRDFRYKTVNDVKGVRYWSDNGRPVFDDQGGFRGYRGLSKDITDLIVAENRTRDTIHQFRSAIENLTDGFLIMDRDFRVLICNQRMLDFNEDVADLIVPGAKLTEVAKIRKERGEQPFDGQTISDVLEEGALQFTTGSEQFLRSYKDGRRMIVKLLKLPDGGIVVTETDISDLVRAQEEAIEASRHYRRAFDATPVMLHYTDQKQCILQVNQCWLDTLGYKTDEVIGKPISEFMEDPAPEITDSQFIKRILSPNGTSPELKWRFVSKTGDIIETMSTIVPDYEVQSNSVRYLVCSRNITEQLKIDRMKGEFVSIVSHELRTPLTSIVGALGLLSGGAAGTVPEEMKSMVRLAKSNADRLVRLINDILDVGRIETGEVALRNELLDVDQVVREAVESCRPYAEMNKVAFIINCDVPGVKIWADKDRFVQVMANLLSNAAKFSPWGGTVQVRVMQVEQTVRIEVVDDGPGIPKEFRPVVFEKFSQADASDARGIGGTGLGLNIAKTIVEKMRGTIGFEDEAKGGTMFYVVLPIANNEDAKEAGLSA